MSDSERMLENARGLRRNLTGPECKLWFAIRNRNLAGLKFRQQVPLFDFVVDFYCAEHSLVLELDGDSHIDQFEYDVERQRKLEESGFRVLRFGNDDVLKDLDAVLAAILVACGFAAR